MNTQSNSAQKAARSGPGKRPVGGIVRPGHNWWRRIFPRTQAASLSPWNAALRILEAALFIALALLFSFWSTPTDPFGLASQFPWIWIVPAVLAMRYGTGIGIISVVLLLASWLVWSYLFPSGSGKAFPQVYFLGGLVLTLLCGQFCEVWNARSRRLSAINSYLDERLTMLTKKHFLLRLSHERLEQDLLSKPLTLRESLERMQALTMNQAVSADNPLPAANAFMQILVQSCQLEVAALHPCDQHGKVQPQALATLGQVAPLDLSDPLLLYCLEQKKLAHVQTIAMPHQQSSRYLICAPLKNFDDSIFGVLVVEKLPFVALNDDMLQLLSVLVDYYADGVQMSGAAHEIVAEVPGCPPDLATDIVRLHRLKNNTDIDSALVALVLDDDENSRDMFEQIKRLKRAADVVWEISADAPSNPTPNRRNVLITLLPLAGSAAVEGYLMRIEDVMQAQFGGKFLASYAQIHTEHMGSDSPVQMLKKLVQRCAV